MNLLLIVIALMVIETQSHALPSDSNITATEHEISSYLERVNNCNYSGKNCFYLRSDTHFVNRWLQILNCTSFSTEISLYMNLNNIDNRLKFDSIFIFISTAEELRFITETLSENQFWHPLAKTNLIIIHDLLEKRKFLKETFRNLWDKGIYNVVVIIISEVFEVYSYKPYEEDIVHQIMNNNRFCHELHEEKWEI